jgi:hypothetical protein
MSCHRVIPIPQTIGVRLIKKEDIEAVIFSNNAYARCVVANTRSNPPSNVRRPIAFPKSENILTYSAHEAVYELVKFPDLAISTAPNESPE